jgi:hypothetical protein
MSYDGKDERVPSRSSDNSCGDGSMPHCTKSLMFHALIVWDLMYLLMVPRASHSLALITILLLKTMKCLRLTNRFSGIVRKISLNVK